MSRHDFLPLGTGVCSEVCVMLWYARTQSLCSGIGIETVWISCAEFGFGYGEFSSRYWCLLWVDSCCVVVWCRVWNSNAYPRSELPNRQERCESSKRNGTESASMRWLIVGICMKGKGGPGK